MRGAYSYDSGTGTGILAKHKVTAAAVQMRIDINIYRVAVIYFSH
jgi:hypothetical protein